MELVDVIKFQKLRHDVRSSFWDLLREALNGQTVAVALGPLYVDDPAADLLKPYVRSARESGWQVTEGDTGFAPPSVMKCAYETRRETAEHAWLKRDSLDFHSLNEWTRAGLVLEIASRGGIPLSGGISREHTRWRLNATVTERFGVEPGGLFNPMVIPKNPEPGQIGRDRIRPEAGRAIAVIDFSAFDVTSMVSVVPMLRERYFDAEDYHQRTAEIMGISRTEAKLEIFRHGYGGHSSLGEDFAAKIPELNWLRNIEPHGEGARLVQRTSARAFRAALSDALPLLVTGQVRPIFTVHDELVLDFSVGSERKVEDVAKAMAHGCTRSLGVRSQTKVKTGRSYAEAKADDR